MFVIKDKCNHVLLDDGSWEHINNAERPYRLFPRWILAEEALEEMVDSGGHPTAEVTNLGSLHIEIHSETRKQLKKEKRALRTAKIVPLNGTRVFRRVRDSGFEMVFDEFRATHLIVSQRQSIIGLIGETDDPQLPFYSYVGDDYFFVFSEEKCYSTEANPEEAIDSSDWREDGF